MFWVLVGGKDGTVYIRAVFALAALEPEGVSCGPEEKAEQMVPVNFLLR